jgi:hypothetical protein
VVAAAVQRLQENFQMMLGELKRSLLDYNPALSREESDKLWGNKNSADLVDRGEWMMLYVSRSKSKEALLAVCCERTQLLRRPSHQRVHWLPWVPADTCGVGGVVATGAASCRGLVICWRRWGSRVSSVFRGTRRTNAWRCIVHVDAV